MNEYIGWVIVILVLLILNVALMIINFKNEYKQYKHNMEDPTHGKK